MKKIWHDQAWEDYLNLQNDKKNSKKSKCTSNTELIIINKDLNYRK